MADSPEWWHRGPADPHTEITVQMERASFLTQASLRNAFARMGNLEAVLNELLEALAANQLIQSEQVPLAVRAYGQQVDDARGPNGVSDLQAGELMAPDEEPALATRWPGVVLRNENEEKELNQPVDCAARMSVCHAVCCSLKFPLSASEVEKGKVNWDLGHPYMIRGDTSGYCSHNDPETGGCGVYENRPGVCRGYSCAEDPRIWKDFEGMVINSEWLADHFTDPGRVHVTLRTSASDSAP